MTHPNDALEALDRIEKVLCDQFKGALKDYGGDTFVEIETIRAALTQKPPVIEGLDIASYMLLLGISLPIKEAQITTMKAQIDTLQDTVIDCESGHWEDKR